MSSRKRKESPSLSNDINNSRGECSRNLKVRIWDRSDTCDEAKDAQKLEQETSYLTDNNKFFPELVWKSVLEKINKLENIESCSSSTPYFGHLLQGKRINKVVLPKVFGVLAKCYESLDKNDITSPYRETNVNCIPWQRSKPEDNNKRSRYPMTGLLKCRLVCKSWNVAIQSIFENFSRFQLRMDLNLPKEYLIPGLATEFFEQDGYTPQDVLQQFNTTHYDHLEDKPKKNPFLGRCVDITSYRNRDNFQAYFNEILELLRKYGTEIWYFELSCYDKIEGPPMQLVDFYRELKQMVQLMPNLKLLKICLSRRLGDRGLHSLRIPRNWPTVSELQALEQEICGNPFIKLTNLTFLSTEYIPTAIFNQIITQNEHIRQLEVLRQSFHGSYSIFSERLLNLRELSLDICTLSDLKKFENCHVPLKLEKLHLYYQDSAPFISWSRIFTAIENTIDGEMCTELILRMPVPIRDLDKKMVLGESLGYRLNLPKLRRFLIFDDTPLCLDFLLMSKNTLREIMIRTKKNNTRRTVAVQQGDYADFEGKQIIQFLGWKDKMEESNIFTELPSVKKVIFMRSGGYVQDEYGRNQVKISKLV